MDRGGAETWLMHVLKHLDQSRFHLDFMTDGTPGAFDSAIGRAGSAILQGPSPRRPWSHASQFGRLLEAHGPYDVVHSHVHWFSGVVMRSAAVAGVPVRIAHSHSDTERMDAQASLRRKAYILLSRHWIRHYATCGLGVSRAAARSLFGGGWESDQRVSVLHCGIDLAAFPGRCERAAMRAAVGLPAESRVYAHVGRFEEPKNHVFLIQVFSQIARLDPAARFVLVGDGPLRSRIESEIVRAGICSRTRLLGVRSDVPDLMTGLVDVLLLPSRWEGLPIVLIESQAAGVPALCSDAVTEEVTEAPELIHRFPLERSPEHWARAAVAIGNTRATALRRRSLARGRFDIREGVRRLEEIYSKQFRQAKGVR